MFRDPIDTELEYRSELTAEERTYLVECALRKRRIRTRGTDPAYPGSTFWTLAEDVRITLWPIEERLWTTHCRSRSADVTVIVQHLAKVVATHPPTRH